MAILVQILPLIGVVIGAAASYLVTAAAEKSRWRHSLQVRWDEKRVDAYSEYGSAVKNLFHLTLRIAAYRKIYEGGSPLSQEEADEPLRHANLDRARKWERVLLVGSPDTIVAARAWHELVWRMTDIVRADFADQIAWKRLLDESNEARSRYYDSARRDLSIAGNLPEFTPMSKTTVRLGRESG
jgi:hypothetical protein